MDRQSSSVVAPIVDSIVDGLESSTCCVVVIIDVIFADCSVINLIKFCLFTNDFLSSYGVCYNNVYRNFLFSFV